MSDGIRSTVSSPWNTRIQPTKNDDEDEDERRKKMMMLVMVVNLMVMLMMVAIVKMIRSRCGRSNQWRVSYRWYTGVFSAFGGDIKYGGFQNEPGTPAIPTSQCCSRAFWNHDVHHYMYIYIYYYTIVLSIDDFIHSSKRIILSPAQSVWLRSCRCDVSSRWGDMSLELLRGIYCYSMLSKVSWLVLVDSQDFSMNPLMFG